jgi:mannose-6-phosphate isomerase-like protein (cupin superfamily)
MNAIALEEKFGLFDSHWTPKIIAQLNGQDVKLAKIQGDFIWHSHDNQDELFHVIHGHMTMEFRDRKVDVGPGEIIVVPKGVEHRPVTKEEVWILLFEPQNIHHTGGQNTARTVVQCEHI